MHVVKAHRTISVVLEMLFVIKIVSSRPTLTLIKAVENELYLKLINEVHFILKSWPVYLAYKCVITLI